jgi:hypothetical protein
MTELPEDHPCFECMDNENDERCTYPVYRFETRCEGCSALGKCLNTRVD